MKRAPAGRICRPAVALGTALLFFVPAEASATLPHSFPRLSAGGGFAGKAGMAEVTWSPLMPGPHLSAGAAIGLGEGYGYAELAASLLLTLGAGVGYRFMSKEAEPTGPHWHLALSTQIPLLGWYPSMGAFHRSVTGIFLHDDPVLTPRLLYLAPFVRWRTSFDGSRNETTFGALLKFSFGPGSHDRHRSRGRTP